MAEARPDNDEQAALWNGVVGRNWVEEQALLDRIFEPLEALLLEALPTGSGGRALDVGCGTGGTTLAVARWLGAGGRCLGIDISEPMIAAARVRAEAEGTPARFLCGDAQSHAFEPASFDMVLSRIGVMFFDDSRRAFRNLRRAARVGAELRFVAWRSAEENPFMTAAERAAAPLLPDLPERRPGAPGQFAFADRDRIRRILADSGWTEVEIRPADLACALPETDLLRYLTRLGPVGRVLDELDEPTRSRVVEAARAAFDPFLRGREVRFTAACWMVGARAAPRTPKETGRA